MYRLICKKRLKAVAIFIVLLNINLLGYTQQRSGGNPAGGRSSIGKLSGKIIDASTSLPLEFATVSVISRKDSSLVTGGTADQKGNFLISDIPAGAYKIRVSFMGYRSAIRDSLNFSPNKSEINLGIIKLNPVQQTLNEVVVSGQKEVFEQSIDKKVFNVEKSIVADGGSATDILETIPSVAVDTDGNISLRGSGGVLILIDGKPSTLSGGDRTAILEQIPASTIESIEVVTNPSAKYDAEGMSGIINIVLKKNKLQGTNGMVMLSAGTRDKYNASFNLNHRIGKFNVFTNYSYRYYNSFHRGRTYREKFSSDTLSILDQTSDATRLRDVHLIRGGFDYYLNSKNTIGMTGMFNTSMGDDMEKNLFNEYFPASSIRNQSFRNNAEIDQRKNYDLNLNYRRTFNKPKQELTASALLSLSDDSEEQLMDGANPASSAPAILQRTNNTGDDYVITLQADYVHPLKEKSNIEAGYKSIIRNNDNDFIFEDFSPETGLWQLNPLKSNYFVYEDQVHSLYGNYSNMIKKFGYQVGLRMEQTVQKSVQKLTDDGFSNNYLNLFPSVFFAYQLQKEQQLQLNYSRRINRPGMRELNPFIDYSDTLNLRQGNPTLNPEFTNAFEVSYMKGWKKTFLTSSVYYRRTDDIIQRYIQVYDNNVSMVTYKNLNNRQSYGLEFILRNNFTSWWNVTTTYNFFRSSIDGSNQNTNFTNDNITWSLTVMSNMDIPKIVQIQIFGDYRGPMALAQGIMKEMYGINIGARKDLWKNRASIGFNLSDIFDTREFRLEATGDDFTQNLLRKRESRIGTLSFTWKFGKYQDKDSNRQGRRGENSGGGGDEDFF